MITSKNADGHDASGGTNTRKEGQRAEVHLARDSHVRSQGTGDSTRAGAIVGPPYKVRVTNQELSDNLPAKRMPIELDEPRFSVETQLLSGRNWAGSCLLLGRMIGLISAI